MTDVKPGDRRRTLLKKRIVIAREVVDGQVSFLFEGDPADLPFQRRVSVKRWLRNWDPA